MTAFLEGEGVGGERVSNSAAWFKWWNLGSIVLIYAPRHETHLAIVLINTSKHVVQWMDHMLNNTSTKIIAFFVTSPNFDFVNVITILLLTKIHHESIMTRAILMMNIANAVMSLCAIFPQYLVSESESAWYSDTVNFYYYTEKQCGI